MAERRREPEGLRTRRSLAQSSRKWSHRIISVAGDESVRRFAAAAGRWRFVALLLESGIGQGRGKV